MLNLSSLFFTTTDEACLHDELDLTPAEKNTIAQARNDVRNRLRDGLPQVLERSGYAGEIPRPRFFTQGSWAYGTLNAPAHPHQQADVDDGCYLPMSFVAGEHPQPSAAANVFFGAAEEALQELIDERPGWKLVTDKPTCIRIVIGAKAHIDIPLYAIPDDQFKTLTEALRVQYGVIAMESAIVRAEHDSWFRMPVHQVLLAHRECNWKASDPRPVKKWFEGQVEISGLQLKRVVRYLKAFRDWKWPSGGPSSILLMAAAAPLFAKQERRDDLALRDVVMQLPAALRAGVSNPTDPGESLTERLGAEMVEHVATTFTAFGRVLTGAIDASDGGQACRWLRNEFGARFPLAPERAKLVSLAAAIAATPAVAGPSEIVGRTKAG